MTEDARRAILRLKHLRTARQFAATSYHIYRAVLLGGVRDVAEARAWLRTELAT